jgi:hypothetical protein
MSTQNETTQLTNLGRKKSATFAVKVFAIASSMLLSSLVIGTLMSDTSVSQGFLLTIPIAIAAMFFGLIAYFLGEKLIWKESQRHPQGQPVFDRISIGLIVVACLFGGFNTYTKTSSKREADAKEQERVAALTPEERQAEIEAKQAKEQAELDAKLEKERAHKLELTRIGFARDATEGLRNSMRDPQSLTVESLGVNKDANLACIEYRAKNGFGGMNRGFAVVQNGRFYFDKAEVWNKSCSHASLYDMMFVVK